MLLQNINPLTGQYEPLPDCVELGPSPILIDLGKTNGLGVIAKEDIPAGTEVDITHIFSLELFGRSLLESWIHLRKIQPSSWWWRTPLGGQYNHSDNPNCRSVWRWNKKYLVTIQKISKGKELAARYKLYRL